MIYCVVPPELADDIFDDLVEHYRDDSGVEVIIDRRSGPDRRQGDPGEYAERRETRDRRRRRIAGTFSSIELPD